MTNAEDPGGLPPVLTIRPLSPRGETGQLSSEVRRARSECRTALVSMPFISGIRPSIQLGLLKSIGESHGFPVDTFHLNLEFAKQIEPEVYEALSESGRNFLGDWLFSVAAFGADAPDSGCLLTGHNSKNIAALFAPFAEKIGDLTQFIRNLREVEVPIYLDRIMGAVDWGSYHVVGFTSTFQQNVASFALASRIKAEHPSVITLFGGSNFEGEMGLELTRAIPCIDYVADGEGDLTFPEFLIALQEGRDPSSVPGIVCRRNGTVRKSGGRPPFEDLDNLPNPDYAEFFDRAEVLELLPKGPRREVRVPFESARGCWWGAKHHCTFCGLNGKTMAFRAKSSERVKQELSDAASKYHNFSFFAVDNILDMSYLKTFCVDLIGEGLDYDLFYEVKSNLTREQIKLLGDAGIRRVQPGIESLNSHVLQLMEKGVSGIQNVNTLRWGQYYGVGMGWNLLYGFPGETPEDYRQQAGLLRNLSHLNPPDGAGRIWMERFSPIFTKRERFPVRYFKPHSSYSFIYPQNVDLEKIAYFFEYEFNDSLPESEFEETHGIVKSWTDAWKTPVKPALTYWSSKGFLQIEDTRNPAEPGTYTFHDPLASIYTALSNRPRPAAKIQEELNLPWPLEEIEGAMNEFCERGLMMREGNLFLSLALPATRGR